MMRIYPTKTMMAIKRSFFDESMAGVTDIGGGVFALKGIYQSLRPAQVLFAPRFGV